MPSLTDSLETALEKALNLAGERSHEYSTLEHLLLALTEDTDAVEVMTACKVDIPQLRQSLTQYIDDELSSLITDSPATAVQPTAAFQRVVQRAILHVESSGRDEVSGANVLISIFSERESHAAYFLQEQDMTRYDAVNFVSHGLAKSPGMSRSTTPRGSEETEQQQKPGPAKEALEAYCVNLNEKAKQGKVDPLIGRDFEIGKAFAKAIGNRSAGVRLRLATERNRAGAAAVIECKIVAQKQGAPSPVSCDRIPPARVRS